MPAVQEFVDAKVKNGKVVVFSKSYCPYCKRTKSLLNGKVKADALEYIEIENRPDMNEMQDYLLKITGGRSVPRVFIGGKFVGGNDETQAANQSGKLNTMLKEIGAAL
ncbi:glutaredoxin-1-like [Amphiura filiformis]|uniref:glutaredoxin-1-like n=1 Tax=Amphiura filiformis TaxID=82378 RepID=UPI003B216D4A